MAHGEYLRLPSDAFYPYLYDEPYSRILFKDLSRTYGIHIWGGSWRPSNGYRFNHLYTKKGTRACTPRVSGS